MSAKFDNCSAIAHIVSQAALMETELNYERKVILSVGGVLKG